LIAAVCWLASLIDHRQIQDGDAELGRHNIRVRGPGVMGNLPGLIFLRAISQNG
jgi:hypothetical protein